MNRYRCRPSLGPSRLKAWTALSIAVTFVDEIGEASADMILRKPNGSIIFSAYRYLFDCKDVLEAEISTILEGLSLSLKFYLSVKQPVRVYMLIS